MEGTKATLTCVASTAVTGAVEGSRGPRRPGGLTLWLGHHAGDVCWAGSALPQGLLSLHRRRGVSQTGEDRLDPSPTGGAQSGGQALFSTLMAPLGTWGHGPPETSLRQRGTQPRPAAARENPPKIQLPRFTSASFPLVKH